MKPIDIAPPPASSRVVQILLRLPQLRDYFIHDLAGTAVDVLRMAASVFRCARRKADRRLKRSADSGDHIGKRNHREIILSHERCP